MIAGGFTCQRYGFNVGADKFSLLTIENGKNKHYAPIGMDIDFPKPKISLRQAARSYQRPNWIHRNSANFLFVDGHVQNISDPRGRDGEELVFDKYYALK